jgi:cell fate (sporulation/competence/biofilm development) regulator YlbF (YheA/YmcA/DUF963 family)
LKTKLDAFEQAASQFAQAQQSGKSDDAETVETTDGEPTAE